MVRYLHVKHRGRTCILGRSAKHAFAPVLDCGLSGRREVGKVMIRGCFLFFLLLFLGCVCGVGEEEEALHRHHGELISGSSFIISRALVPPGSAVTPRYPGSR